jgi:uncharacterized protein YceK
MAVQHVIRTRRMYVYGDNSDQPASCQCILQPWPGVRSHHTPVRYNSHQCSKTWTRGILDHQGVQSQTIANSAMRRNTQKNWKPKNCRSLSIVKLPFRHVYRVDTVCTMHAHQMRRLRRRSADVRPHPLRQAPRVNDPQRSMSSHVRPAPQHHTHAPSPPARPP